jgi:hypothetical protein
MCSHQWLRAMVPCIKSALSLLLRGVQRTSPRHIVGEASGGESSQLSPHSWNKNHCVGFKPSLQLNTASSALPSRVIGKLGARESRRDTAHFQICWGLGQRQTPDPVVTAEGDYVSKRLNSRRLQTFSLFLFGLANFPTLVVLARRLGAGAYNVMNEPLVI